MLGVKYFPLLMKIFKKSDLFIWATIYRKLITNYYLVKTVIYWYFGKAIFEINLYVMNITYVLYFFW